MKREVRQAHDDGLRLVNDGTTSLEEAYKILLAD